MWSRDVMLLSHDVMFSYGVMWQWNKVGATILTVKLTLIYLIEGMFVIQSTRMAGASQLIKRSPAVFVIAWIGPSSSPSPISIWPSKPITMHLSSSRFGTNRQTTLSPNAELTTSELLLHFLNGSMTSITGSLSFCTWPHHSWDHG